MKDSKVRDEIIIRYRGIVQEYHECIDRITDEDVRREYKKQIEECETILESLCGWQAVELIATRFDLGGIEFQLDRFGKNMQCWVNDGMVDRMCEAESAPQAVITLAEKLK